jgi:hypothetical protein
MRRGDPNRIYAAKLAGLRSRILGEWRQSEERTDGLLREWETEASTRGLHPTEPAYWDDAAVWISERVPRR